MANIHIICALIISIDYRYTKVCYGPLMNLSLLPASVSTVLAGRLLGFVPPSAFAAYAPPASRRVPQLDRTPHRVGRHRSPPAPRRPSRPGRRTAGRRPRRGRQPRALSPCTISTPSEHAPLDISPARSGKPRSRSAHRSALLIFGPKLPRSRPPPPACMMPSADRGWRLTALPPMLTLRASADQALVAQPPRRQLDRLRNSRCPPPSKTRPNSRGSHRAGRAPEGQGSSLIRRPRRIRRPLPQNREQDRRRPSHSRHGGIGGRCPRRSMAQRQRQG